METFELILLLALYAMGLGWLGRRLGIIDPIMLVLGGLVLAAFDFAPEIRLDPKTVLAVFLPPVLYQAALHISWSELKANLRAVLLLAIGLVLFTAFAVAGSLWLMVPGLPFAAALVLGAIVSPPDAVAATSVLSKVRAPSRLTTILEGESLINDATALVLYALAVKAVVYGTFTPSDALIEFIKVGLGGMALGLLIGRVSIEIHRRLAEPLLEIMLSLTIPFLTFILAEHLHLSGVIAVVAAGIIRASYNVKVFSAASRMQMFAMWDIIVFILNAIGFLLIGLQISTVFASLSDRYSLLQLAQLSFVICAIVIVTRFIWVWPATWLPHLLSRHVRETEPRPQSGKINVISWAGMRGIVSLVAALALPTQIEPYGNFPGRDLILFITYMVILVTLVGQGSTLGWLVRKLKVEAVSCAPNQSREIRAQLRLAGLLHVQKNANGHSATAIERLSDHYQKMIAHLRAHNSEDALEDLITKDSEDYRGLAMAALSAERLELEKMREHGRINDELARELQLELDLHELLIGTERADG